MGMLWIFACARHVTLEIETVPQKAVVLLDGMPICYESPCMQEVEKGTHTIVVQAENFALQEFTRTLQNHHKESIQLQAKGGWFSLSTEPSQLPIAVDGAMIGLSPLSKVFLSEGMHDVQLQRGCYHAQTIPIHIQSDQEFILELRAEPVLADISIRFENRIGEEPLMVIADGNRLGLLTENVKLPLCTHNLSLVSSSQWATSTLQEHHWKQKQVDLVLEAIPKENQESLLGYVPPLCILESGVDAKCVHNWFERIRLEAEERNEHIHHEGCAHE